MEMRLLLAFLLMGAVMFLTPYFFKSALRRRPPRIHAAADHTAAAGRGARAAPRRRREGHADAERGAGGSKAAPSARATHAAGRSRH